MTKFNSKEEMIQARAESKAAMYEGAIMRAEIRAAEDESYFVSSHYAGVLGKKAGWQIDNFGWAEV